ncbi:MAG: hypothetical protein WD766_15280 [Gemmatimonadota bacterium]
MSARLRAGAVALVTLAAGCELAEVAAPKSSDLLVVEAVMRVGQARQYVLLHRSLEGDVVRGEPGAMIVVVGPNGERVSFAEAPLAECLYGTVDGWGLGATQIEATCYRSPAAASHFVMPGAEYELEVETLRGEIARARSRVPEAVDYRVPAVSVDPLTRVATCRLSNEPFTLVWSRAEGAWSYIVSLRLSGWGDELREQGVEVPDPLELTGVSVSAADTTLRFPENLGLFQRGDFDQRIFQALNRGLPEGAASTLVVVANDRNYTNAIRGGRFNPSGQVRGSSIVGDAVGVFGSVAPVTIRSVPPADGSPLPPCGA